MKKLLLTNFFSLSLVFCLFLSCKTPENNSTGGGQPGGPPPEDDGKLKPYKTYTINKREALPGSPYHYEMWTEGGNNNKLIWYGPNQGGGAAFRAEWNSPNDFLGRVGYYWDAGKPYTYYGNIFCDFEYTRSDDKTAGDYSYIGIYGWSKNQLIEYYIVEDWFSNRYYSSWNPVGKDTIGVNSHGSYSLDGETYLVYKKTRTGPSISGNTTFTQYFSVRKSQRKKGTISITEHFKKWENLEMKLGTNMFECKFLVEAGGGTGWFDASYLTFYQKD